jgi:N-acetyl-gamma-glutamyl-phosphate reductase
MVKVGIVGISGYSGCEALKILLKHPQVRLTYVSANNTEGKISEIWPQFSGQTDLVCKKFQIKEAVSHCELIILAVPHTVSMQITPDLLKAGLRVIDLSGDYRLKDTAEYKKWYGADHVDTKSLSSAVYGLPELFRENIKKAKLISNPGCYPTAALLGLLPLTSTLSESIELIVIDAKSGVSGAGRKATLNFSFGEVNENFKAYKVLNHQHAPEIDLYLSSLSKIPAVEFVPHLLPINRGILETIYVRLNRTVDLNEIHKIYQRFYKIEPFVRVLPLGLQPELRNVNYTNYCDVALSLNKSGNLLAITSVIDNLLKGASGQAVQNMNIMYGFKEDEGLK